MPYFKTKTRFTFKSQTSSKSFKWINLYVIVSPAASGLTDLRVLTWTSEAAAASCFNSIRPEYLFVPVPSRRGGTFQTSAQQQWLTVWFKLHFGANCVRSAEGEPVTSRRSAQDESSFCVFVHPSLKSCDFHCCLSLKLLLRRWKSLTDECFYQQFLD